jgi:hypothetical protein
MVRPRLLAATLLAGFVLAGAIAFRAPAGRSAGRPVAPAVSQPDAVPAPLAAALVGGAGDDPDDAPRFSVGRAPDGFPAELVPPAPAALVGGAAWRDARTVVVAYPQARKAAVDAYAAFAGRAGWAPPASRGRGFVVSYLISGARDARVLCRGDAQLWVASAPGAASGSHVTARLMTGPKTFGCGTPMHEPDFGGLALPSLVPPAGARHEGGGGGGSDNSSHATTRLTTPTGAAELATHYGAQLAAAGWTVGPTTPGAGVATRTAEVRDPRGRLWRGALLVAELGGEREVALQMSREGRP